MNEKKCKSINEVLKEVKKSNSEGCGITGGDPLCRLQRTIKYANALKKKFKKFHIHIYLSTKIVNKDNLKKLSKVVDEVRFHPESLSKNNNFKDINKDIEKIKLGLLFFKKENTGVEIPVFPDLKKQTFEFIKEISKIVEFVNLNELEVGENNINYIVKKYHLDKDGYTVKGSKEAGLWILNKCEKEKINIKIHFCTAETKNWHQFKNRLKNHEILKFGKKTEDGTVIYFIINYQNNKKLKEIKKELNKKNYYLDREKSRFIINSQKVREYKNKFQIKRVEEYPTSDRIEVEKELVY